MHKKFDNKEIEERWKQKWKDDGLYDVGSRNETTEKEYVLVELPYPSGNLHIGHWHAFAVPDIYVRFQRMNGKQVIYPMGFDAFGLPAENAAIKRDLDPRKWTEGNIEKMRGQLESMGCAFSWDKTASTIDPNYYKWTQWMFSEFFNKNIAYRGEGTVNWCPGCNTVIANEQVTADGLCERSGDVIEQKRMPQWMLRITDYADRLLEDLDDLQWPEHIKEAQRQWIGKSAGARIPFTLSTGHRVDVFTTRPDTLYGATYLVLAPEHTLVQGCIEKITNRNEVAGYVKEASAKEEQDRLNQEKEKTGVKLDGITARNPANNEEIPVYIADYVLAGYGTGAIMAVPAHDQRDFEFATKFDLPIIQTVKPVFGKSLENEEERRAVTAFIFNPKTQKYLFVKSHEFDMYVKVYGGIEEGESAAEAAVRETEEETGYKTKFVRQVGGEVEAHFYHPGKKINRKLTSVSVLLELIDQTQYEIDSEELQKQEPVWLSLDEAKRLITDPRELFDLQNLIFPQVFAGQGTLINSGEFNGMDSEDAKEAITQKVEGELTSTYRLRDWSVGRQRYWGVPIPIVYDPEGKAHPIPLEHLPWTLPEDVDFRPTGEPPLAKSKELKERTEAIFGKGWTPEVETLDTFVDSSWYFLRYLDNQNSSEACSKEQQEKWMPVDLYFGGAEHTTMHLLYSRFWQKALYDLGHVIHSEPYTQRINRGLILGPDGNKMSKSKGNVVDPDDHVATVGADTVKMYLAFMGPYGEAGNYPWDMGAIAGIRRFLERVYGLSEHVADTQSDKVTQLFHQTIQKVRDDIPKFKFNTAISALMIFVNEIEKTSITKETYTDFLRLCAPFAPFLAEELWAQAGNTSSIHTERFPVPDAALVLDQTVTIGVQINGKIRGQATLDRDATEAEALAAAQALPALQKYLGGTVEKVIYIPGKILNIIVGK